MATNIQSSVSLFLVLFLASIYSSSLAYKFIVGGKDGWVINPSEKYNLWAERLRFQVNDTLVFKYKKGSDSVLMVNKDDYTNCITENPVLKLDDGNSFFTFNRSGPFFFISGTKSNCVSGQKLVIIVMAVRGSPSPPRSSTAPPPSALPAPPPTNAEAPSSSNSSLSSPPPEAEAPASATSANRPSTNSTPEGDTPADVNGGEHPHRRSFATPACSTPSFVVVSTVSLVLSACLAGFTLSV